ncbi:MAG: serine hydrolase domain-containing protein [Crocinitomicaceae bacterium]
MNKIFLLSVLISINTTFAQTNSFSNKSFEADSIFQSYCNPKEPGMAIGVVQDGKVIYKSSKGIADLSNRLSITDSTVFNIASVSKQFTALMALIAEQEGKLKLSDDIRKYLPELKSIPNKITIKQLANHTHGLPNYSDLTAMMGFDLATPISNEQAVETILDAKQVNFKAGTQYQYGNSGFMLLAEILKRVYKKPFPKLLKEKIFEPLNMTQTAVIDDPDIIVNNKAIAYRKNDGSFSEHLNRQMECGSSNIYTTLNDFIKWSVNFQIPKVGTSSQIKRLTTKTVSISKDGDLGYGLGYLTETYKGLKTVFHGGGTAGYRAYILHVPEHNLSIVTLGNKESFDGLLVIKDLLELYFKDYLAQPNPVKTLNSSKELKKFGGVYKAQPGQYWTIKTDDKNLYFGDDTNPLPKVGNNKYEFYLPTSYLTFHSNSMEFRIADFNYHYEKVDFNAPSLSKKELEKYVGIFKNEEFNTFYELLIIEGNLIAKHLTNGEITLHPLSKNSFYAKYPLGELNFLLNSKEEVNGFILLGTNLNNIKFIKIN